MDGTTRLLFSVLFVAVLFVWVFETRATMRDVMRAEINRILFKTVAQSKAFLEALFFMRSAGLSTIAAMQGLREVLARR